MLWDSRCYSSAGSVKEDANSYGVGRMLIPEQFGLAE